MFAYESTTSDSNPCTNRPFTTPHPTCNATNITTDSALDTNDGSEEVHWAIAVPTAGYVYGLFEAVIDESKNDITIVNWTIDTGIGYAFYLYVWNFTSGSYQECLYDSNGGAEFESCAYNNDMVNSSGNSYFLFESKDVSDVFTSLVTDFVKLEITYVVPPKLKTDISFINTSNGHWFNTSATFNHTQGYENITRTWVDVTSGTCINILNTTSGNDFTPVFNCSGTALQETYIRINVNDSEGNTVNSSNLTNTYPNNAPTIPTININATTPTDAEDLLCNVTTSDGDTGDTVSVTYDWYNNSISLGFNTSVLKSANTTTNDNWYCTATPWDGYENGTSATSETVSIGTAFAAPTITFVNATNGTSGINSSASTPTNNNSWINMSVTFTDPNDEKWTAFFCKTNTFASGSCSGGSWGTSDLNSTLKNLSVRVNMTGLTLNSYDYYAFVLDNYSLSSSGTKGTFHVNRPPTTPTIVSPIINYSVNWTVINFTSTDPNSDSINWTIYNSSDGTSWSELANATTSGYNWTLLNDGMYFLKARARDEHNYLSLENSSVYNFTIDGTPPNITNATTSGTSAYTTDSITFSVETADTLSSIDNCYFELYKTDQSPDTWNLTSNTISGTTYSKPQSMSSYGTGTLEFRKVYCLDVLGNIAINSSVGINITISTAPSGSPSGGGGGTDTECFSNEDCIPFGANYYCQANKCILNLSIITPLAFAACNYNGLCESDIGESWFNCRCDLAVGCGAEEEGSGDCSFSFGNLIGSDPTKPSAAKFLLVITGIAGVLLMVLFAPTIFKSKRKGLTIIKIPQKRFRRYLK